MYSSRRKNSCFRFVQQHLNADLETIPFQLKQLRVNYTVIHWSVHNVVSFTQAFMKAIPVHELAVMFPFFCMCGSFIGS